MICQPIGKCRLHKRMIPLNSILCAKHELHLNNKIIIGSSIWASWIHLWLLCKCMQQFNSIDSIWMINEAEIVVWNSLKGLWNSFACIQFDWAYFYFMTPQQLRSIWSYQRISYSAIYIVQIVFMEETNAFEYASSTPPFIQPFAEVPKWLAIPSNDTLLTP